MALLSIFVLAGGPLLGLLYGDFYRDSGLLLALLAIGQSTNVWTGPCGAVLQMTGHQRALLTINLTYGGLAFILSVIFVDDLGLTAVAAFTGGALVLQNLTLVVYARAKTGLLTLIDLRPSNLRSLRASVLVPLKRNSR